MPICKTCGLAFLETESHVCQRGALATGSSWWARLGRGDIRRPGRRSVLIAWAIALTLCAPLVFLTGDLMALEMVVIAFVAFPSGLFWLLSPLGVTAFGDSPLGRSIVGWVVYACVSVVLLVARSEEWRRRLFILLCVLLAANVIGCFVPLAPPLDEF